MLLRYSRREKKNTALTAILILISAVLKTVNALLIAQIVNTVIARKLNQFVMYLMVALGIYLVYCIVSVVNDWQQARTVGKMTIHLRNDITRGLISDDYAGFLNRETGVYTSWLTADVSVIGKDGFNNGFVLLQTIENTLFSGIALVIYHWSIIVLIIIVGMIVLTIPRAVREKLRAASLNTTHRNETLLSVITNELRGFETLFALGLQNKIVPRINDASKKVVQEDLRQTKYATIGNNLSGMFNIIGQICIIAWTGFLAFQRAVPFGAIMAVGSLSETVLGGIAAFNPIVMAIQALKPVFAKYRLVEPNAQTETKMPVGNADEFEFINVGFQYSAGTQKVSFDLPVAVPASGRVLITGESGRGKSTLLNILAGKLTGYSGSIKLGGMELSAYQPLDIQKHVLYVGQRPYLFAGTIRDNLLLGETFSDEQITIALEMADLTEFVDTLPTGLDTDVGESGQSISGGQQQRIALARSLLRAPTHGVILFDEVTNSLSTEQAVQVERNLLKYRNATLIFVSHQVHDEVLGMFDQVVTL